MTPRTRRTLIITLIVVALLVLGRWTSELLTTHWWAAAIAPEAAAAVGRWQRLGLGLDALAIVIASAWFILLAITIGRTISAVHITRRIANLDLRQTIPTRYLLAGAIAVGILLGWLSGAGASRWRTPVVLAWQGVDWPAQEPLLGADLETLLVRLPLWEAGHEYLQTLLLVGLVFTGTLYLVIGALRRQPQGLHLHPYARRHLGVLLALVATSLAIGFLLDAWRLAAGATPEHSFEALRAHLALTRPAAFLALLTGMASLRWGLGRSARLATIGWGLTLVALVGGALLSARPASGVSRDPGDTATLNDLAWGVLGGRRITDSTAPLLSLWDERALAAHEAAQGRFFLAATPRPAQRGIPAGWLVASTDSGLWTLRTRGVQEGVVTADNAPVDLPALRQEVVGVIRPGAAPWQTTPHGIQVGHALRRLVLTWGRQALGMASLPDTATVDWHLDPSARASALLPMARWFPPDIVLVDGQVRWIVQGLLPVAEFPRAQRQVIRGERLSGLLPAFLALIDPTSGSVQIYLDPAATPPALAWQRFAPELIRPADEIPMDLGELPYSATWAAVQLGAKGGAGGSTTAVWPHRGVPGRQALKSNGVGIRMARTTGGSLSWSSDGTTIDRISLARRLAQPPLLQALRDSVAARGDSLLTGPLRWAPTGHLVWQPTYVVSADGVRLLAIAQLRDDQVSASRRPFVSADPSAVDATSDTLVATPAALALRDARLWLARADSALRRGDLTAFGRYFEALQRVLETGAGREPLLFR